MKEEIKFAYEDGFTGRTYYMHVRGKWHTVGHGLGGPEDEQAAQEKARAILDELGLSVATIVWQWSGTL